MIYQPFHCRTDEFHHGCPARFWMLQPCTLLFITSDENDGEGRSAWVRCHHMIHAARLRRLRCLPEDVVRLACLVGANRSQDDVRYGRELHDDQIDLLPDADVLLWRLMVPAKPALTFRISVTYQGCLPLFTHVFMVSSDRSNSAVWRYRCGTSEQTMGDATLKQG